MLTSIVEFADTSGATIGRVEYQKIIVAKFLAIVEDSLGTRLNIEETSRQIGGPSRSLRYASKRNLGLGPSQYVLHRRMDMARSALQKGKCAVSDAARRSGFWQMGQFAAAYRKLCGEPPSITLKRASVRSDDRQRQLDIAGTSGGQKMGRALKGSGSGSDISAASHFRLSAPAPMA
jgi:AraC-like DNA-binding protein